MAGSMQTEARAGVVDLPKITVDRAGWVAVRASPAWWRSTAQASNWDDVVEQLASLGEKAVSSRLCRVIGATTKTPCMVNTTHEPCPHHGPGNENNRCGAPTAKGTPCRWNLAVHGECSHHPETWQHLLAARRAQEEEEQRQRQAAAQRRAEEQEQRFRDALQMPCSYCAAQPGADCTQQGKNEPASKLHTPRWKLLDHRRVADVVECGSCGAARGELCRTSSGREAADPHVSRERAAAA